MKEKMKEKIIAVIMAALVIAIPVYSASVYAGLSNLQVRGADNVNGYVRQNDFVEIGVTASIDGDSEITASQVKIKNVREFDSCVSGVSGFDCTVRVPSTGTRRFSEPIPFTVELYDDSTRYSDKINGIVNVDSKAPAIKSFSITPKISRTGEATFNYNVEDYASRIGDTTKCSGIEKIEFYENDLTGSLIYSENLGSAECSISSSRQYAAQRSGRIKVCAKAYDRFMQSSALRCDTFIVDSEGPGIDAASLKITDNRNNEITAFSSNPINAVMSILITGDDIEKSSVFANASELNPAEAAYRSLPAVCGATAENATRCAWNFVFRPGIGGAKNIMIRASDVYGNEKTQLVSKTFSFDNVGPVVNSLRTDKADSHGNYYVSSRGSFIASITESSGLNNEDILLHLGSGVYPASNCTAGWSCYWNNITVYGSGKLKAYIGTDSKDILGNHVTQEKSIDVIVDTTRPAITNITIYPVG